MSVQPGHYNIPDVQRRADYDLALQSKDSTGANINLTGWTVYAQVWDAGRTVKHADFAITYTGSCLPPFPESCATAISVPVAANLGACVATAVTSGSTQDGPLGTCSGGTGNTPDDDVWYSFVAPSNGNKLTITTTAGNNQVCANWANAMVIGFAGDKVGR